MSVDFNCGDPAILAGYLYDECEAGERAAFEAHIASCVRCASELKALGATRAALASWAPPDAKLGFRISAADDAVGERGRVLRPQRWWQRPMPAWAQAAAAILIFATGAALGMRTPDRISGGPTPVTTGRAVSASAMTPVVTTVSRDDLAALEQKLRGEMRAMRTASAPDVERPASPSEAAVLQRVRALLSESEQRQQRELAFRLTQVMRDVDAQRQMDLSRIEQTFGQMEGFTRPELANQRQMINYLIQRTGSRQPQ